jgi:hypothetical protein
MSAKEIENRFGDRILVTDDYGAPLAVRVSGEDGRHTAISISVDEARKLARTLDAFAEIHSK